LPPSAEALAQIAAIDGVVNVRMIGA